MNKNRSSAAAQVLILGLGICILVWSCFSAEKVNLKKDIHFTHFVIDSPLPGEGYGTGGFQLADFDGDGDLDISLQRRSDSTLYWYAYQNDSTWIRYPATRIGGGQLGAASLDVDRDGDIDVVMGRAWIENPGNLLFEPSTPWIRHNYHGGLAGENHDITKADINEDGLLDIVCYAQNYSTLRWFDLSDPQAWIYHDIAVKVNDQFVHAGMAPNGVADLNGDQYPDVIMPYYWYQNPGVGYDSMWEARSWPYREIKESPYGKSFRSWILDLDQDKDQDIIIAECDVTTSRAFWYENIEQGESFEEHILTLPAGSTGSFHSLAAADFNLDGLVDIFIGEQEDNNQKPSPGMKPKGLRERGLLFLNIGTATQPEFFLNIIHQDNPGWHDTQAGDVDGDGDPDLVSKIWNADEGGIWHADYWRNDFLSGN